MFGGISWRWGAEESFIQPKARVSLRFVRQRFPRVLPCVNRTNMFLFLLLPGMGIAWLADVKSYFSFYFKRPSVYDIYDIGPRLCMKTTMSSVLAQQASFFAPIPIPTPHGPVPLSRDSGFRSSSHG